MKNNFNYFKTPKDNFAKMVDNKSLIELPVIQLFNDNNFQTVGSVKEADEDNLYCEIYDPSCLNNYDCKTCEFVFENM